MDLNLKTNFNIRDQIFFNLKTMLYQPLLDDVKDETGDPGPSPILVRADTQTSYWCRFLRSLISYSELVAGTTFGSTLRPLLESITRT